MPPKKESGAQRRKRLREEDEKTQKDAIAAKRFFGKFLMQSNENSNGEQATSSVSVDENTQIQSPLLNSQDQSFQAIQDNNETIPPPSQTESTHEVAPVAILTPQSLSFTTQNLNLQSSPVQAHNESIPSSSNVQSLLEITSDIDISLIQPSSSQHTNIPSTQFPINDEPIPSSSYLESNTDVIPEYMLYKDVGFLSFNPQTGKPLLTSKIINDIILYRNDFQHSNGPFESQSDRRMTKNWFVSSNDQIRTWLAYSPVKKAAYCIACLLFSTHPPNSALEKQEGFTIWKKQERIKEHESSKNHKVCVIQMIQLQKSLENRQGLIDTHMQEQLTREKNRWTSILTRIISCIKYLAFQNLPLRGHREGFDSPNQGNFLELVKFLAQYDTVMAEHLSKVESEKGALSYLSPIIQNEIISLMAKMTRQKLLEEIKEAKFFGMLFDATPDNTHREQMSQVFRYVYIHPDTKSVTVKETFLGFFQLYEKDAGSTFVEICNQLERDNLNIQNCRCQSYDNAAVMAGTTTGVAQRFLEINSLAFFSNCGNHTLNLVGVHAVSEVVFMVTFFGTVDSLFKFFSRSTHRWELLKHDLKITLKYQSDTRWSSRVEAIKPILKEIDKLIALLKQLSTDTNENAETRSKAQLLLTRMMSLEFLCFLPFWNDTLDKIDRVQKRLQTKSINFKEAATDIEALEIYFNDKKDATVKSSMQFGKEMCTKHEISIEKRARQGVSYEKQVENAMYESLNQIQTEFDKRFKQLRYLDENFGFLLDVDELIYSESDLKSNCDNFCNTYGTDVNSDNLLKDISSVRALLKPREKLKTPISVLEFIHQFGDELIFPDLGTALQIMLTISVSIASCERSFSKLKLINTHLRSSLGEQKLSDLALISIEKNTLNTINFSEMIEQFAMEKARKAFI